MFFRIYGIFPYPLEVNRIVLGAQNLIGWAAEITGQLLLGKISILIIIKKTRLESSSAKLSRVKLT